MKKPLVIITQGRILHLLTMFVIVPGAGYVTSWTATHLPGLPKFSPGELEAIFITGASSALAAALHFLHGWQWWEKNVGPYVDIEAAKAAKAGPPPPPPIAGV